MFYVSDIEDLKDELLHIFPDAVRGSVAKSQWGRGRKQLHLSYGFSSDTAYGLMVVAKGDLLFFYEWDTNEGMKFLFAESDLDVFRDRLCKQFKHETHHIDRPVRF